MASKLGNGQNTYTCLNLPSAPIGKTLLWDVVAPRCLVTLAEGAWEVVTLPRSNKEQMDLILEPLFFMVCDSNFCSFSGAFPPSCSR